MNMFKSSVDPDSSYALDIGRPEGMVFIFKCKPPLLQNTCMTY